MKNLLLISLIAFTSLLHGQSFVPLINDIEPTPVFNGYKVELGENAEHLSYMPKITKGLLNKAPIVLIGASTPSSIYAELVKFNAQLTDFVFIHAGHGATDIYDYLDLNNVGWVTIRNNVAAAGYRMNDVKWVIMCHDDLKSQSNDFPACAQVLADKEIEFVQLMKQRGQFKNLKRVDIFSRLNGYKITEPKFQTPSDYYNCFAAKFAVESTFSTGHFVSGVWITDAPSMWTNGEEIRSDGFAFQYAWMKPDGGPHIYATGAAYCANWLFNYCKQTREFK